MTTALPLSATLAFSLLTIGEVARRTGVPPVTLRAWERRYGVPQPSRSPSGYRLYGPAAVDEVGSLQAHFANGLKPRQAALLIRHGRRGRLVGDGDRRLPSWRQQFERACLRFDDTAADALIALASRHIGALGVLKQVILPVVASLGDAWHEGIVTVSQEHYASEVARRVAVSAPAAVAGGARSGGLTLTGCAPRERHELGLLALVAELQVHGHRVVHLGSDVPVDAFLAAVDAARPQVVVVAASMRGRLRPWAAQVREVRRRARTGVSFVWAGPGASNPGRMLPGVVADTAEAAIDAVLRALGP